MDDNVMKLVERMAEMAAEIQRHEDLEERLLQLADREERMQLECDREYGAERPVRLRGRIGTDEIREIFGAAASQENLALMAEINAERGEQP